MPFMHLEDDITLDELARELAEIYRPHSLQYLAAALRTIAKQQLSGLTSEQVLARTPRNTARVGVEAGSLREISQSVFTLLVGGNLFEDPVLNEVCHRAVLGFGNGLDLLVNLHVKRDGDPGLARRHKGVARCDELYSVQSGGSKVSHGVALCCTYDAHYSCPPLAGSA